MELQNLFSTVLNMTITGSVVIGCVLLARLALGRAPRGFAYALWAVVLFRLLCPVSVSAPVSVLELAGAPEPKTGVGAVEYVPMPVSAPSETMAVGVLPAQAAAPVPARAEPGVDWHLLGTWTWSAGFAALALYGVVSYVDLKRKLRESTPAGRGIREADGIKSPFVLGLLRPVIYLPAGLGEEERRYILLHERFHVRHGDHLVKAVFWLAVCIHWFNPLVWLAFVLCTRDMEMRCDEAVLKKLGPQVRSDYAQSLLNLAAGRRLVPAPLAFGEGDTGKRVKHVLGWKRSRLWMAVPAAVLCVTVLVLTACNPDFHLVEKQLLFGNRYRATAVLGQADSLERVYGLREHDEHLWWQEGDVFTDLGELKERKLGSGFELSDEDLERQLRESNDLAWKAGEHWLLYQTDGSVYLTEGQDRVLKLDEVRQGKVRVQTAQDFGSSYPLTDYPAGSGLWAQEQQSILVNSVGATLVFTISTEEKILTVVEEYHQMEADGTETVTETTHVLERTPDYGYELPIARRGDYEGDWAQYRVDIGLSSYVCCVRFGMTAMQTQEVTFREGAAAITLQIPEGWSYCVTSLEDDAYSAGITFWPTGREAGVLRFDYYPSGFGVCGTGLETSAMTLAGRNVSVGTYDGANLWDYIAFGDDFAVWGEGHESWWAEYGDEAMEILDSARFGG